MMYINSMMIGLIYTLYLWLTYTQ